MRRLIALLVCLALGGAGCLNRVAQLIGDGGPSDDSGVGGPTDAGDAGVPADGGDGGSLSDGGDAGDAGCDLADAGDDCPGVTCPVNTYCNAADGRCHCGTREGPTCFGQGTCEFFPEYCLALCVTPTLCDDVQCPTPYETCVPGVGCVCGSPPDGGPLPPVCPTGFFCGSFDGGAAPQCFQPCDPYAQNCPTVPPPDGGLPDAAIVQGCYYEPWMNALVCEPVLNPDGYEDQPCSENGDCSPVPTSWGGGMACFPVTAYDLDAGLTRACRYICDTFDGGQHICPGTTHEFFYFQCVPLTLVDAGGTEIPVGVCEPCWDGGGHSCS